MTSMQCQEIRQSDRLQCPYAAKFLIDGRRLCGIHTPKAQRTDDFLIVNAGRKEHSHSDLPDQISGDQIAVIKGKLLNMSIIKIVYMNITFKCLLGGYEAMKFYYEHEDRAITMKLMWHVYRLSQLSDQKKIHELGHTRDLPIRPDWCSRDVTHTPEPLTSENMDELVIQEDRQLVPRRMALYSIRDRFMFDLLTEKFQANSITARELLETGDRDLVDNSSGGSYWSKGPNGHGKNRLGELMTIIRASLSAE